MLHVLIKERSRDSFNDINRFVFSASCTLLGHIKIHSTELYVTIWVHKVHVFILHTCNIAEVVYSVSVGVLQAECEKADTAPLGLHCAMCDTDLIIKRIFS